MHYKKNSKIRPQAVNGRLLVEHNLLHYVFVVFYTLFKSIVKSATGLAVLLVGYFIFQTKDFPYDFVFGLPLVLIGAGFVLNFTGDVLFAIFSPKYNIGVCPFCK